ncbi:glycosyltransferase [Paenibacillus swuensis]|uniref:Glycosyltransferase n=1 Tax=Paenibacillus swuensis TaxID=1178515 RepID=A0A172TG99_9BACL|nr:glycosyltransferase [Paenibacillus swuensis]ANE46061.1 glycosyltransferase [Paenibacillus swuensis]
MKEKKWTGGETGLISVITPTYNRPAVLAEMLESLVRQTYRNFEVIVVNDHGESVEKAVAAYPELDIVLLNLDVNVKHVRARNLALEKARGEFILLLDDDDLLLPGHMERMLEQLSEQDLVYSDVEIFDYRTDADGSRIPTSRLLFAYNDDPREMRTFSTFVASGCMYRRSLHEELGWFDTEVYNYWDWDFYLRASERFRTKRVPVASVLYCFSQSGDNLSNDLGQMRKLYLDRLTAKHGLGELPAKNFFVLLEEPAMKNREASTQVLWDGKGIRSRLSARTESN